MKTDIDIEWELLEKERKLREARERETKRRMKYREPVPPRCCASCQFGDINEDCPRCYFGAYCFDVSPFGLCDKYKPISKEESK